MKKRLLILALSGITLVSLASCNKKDTDNSSKNLEAENKIIEEYSENFLMDTFGLDGFKIDISQSYTINRTTENEKEKEEYNLKYNGNGAYLYFYDYPDTEELNDTTYKTVLGNCNGYLRANQTEAFEVKYTENDLVDNSIKKEEQNVSTNYDFIADFFEDDLVVYSTFDYVDSIDSTQNEALTYAGKYAKADVANAYSNEAFTSFINDIVFMDSYYEYKILNNYIMERMADTTTTEVDSSDLIDGESIEIKEENGSKVIEFNLNTKDLFKDLFELESDTDDIYITGSFIFDAEYEALTAFEFDFTNFLKKLFDLSEDDMTVSNVSFTVEGKEFDSVNDFEVIDLTPSTYDSVDAFVNDLTENTAIYSQIFDENE